MDTEENEPEGKKDANMEMDVDCGEEVGCSGDKTPPEETTGEANDERKECDSEENQDMEMDAGREEEAGYSEDGAPASKKPPMRRRKRWKRSIFKKKGSEKGKKRQHLFLLCCGMGGYLTSCVVFVWYELRTSLDGSEHKLGQQYFYSPHSRTL